MKKFTVLTSAVVMILVSSAAFATNVAKEDEAIVPNEWSSAVTAGTCPTQIFPFMGTGSAEEDTTLASFDVTIEVRGPNKEATKAEVARKSDALLTALKAEKGKSGSGASGVVLTTQYLRTRESRDEKNGPATFITTYALTVAKVPVAALPAFEAAVGENGDVANPTFSLDDVTRARLEDAASASSVENAWHKAERFAKNAQRVDPRHTYEVSSFVGLAEMPTDNAFPAAPQFSPRSAAMPIRMEAGVGVVPVQLMYNIGIIVCDVKK